MKNKFVITFAGPPGSGKSPIANYLSQQFLIPLFNTDSIRKEIAEDNLAFDREKFKELRDERLHKLINKQTPFILDGSVDREWEHYKEMFGTDFDIFIISMDLSKEMLNKLHDSNIELYERMYDSKIYQEYNHDKWMDDHQSFIDKFGDLVNLSITDNAFKHRLKLTEEKVKEWLET